MLCAACGNDEHLHLVGTFVTEVPFASVLPIVVDIEWQSAAGATDDSPLIACMRCGTVRVPQARMS